MEDTRDNLQGAYLLLLKWSIQVQVDTSLHISQEVKMKIEEQPINLMTFLSLIHGENLFRVVLNEDLRDVQLCDGNREIHHLLAHGV
ncbi:hypothetical protein V6N11_027129 [Hibiscus sabdariffa]|uniref:Uncharacterized protein n=1 Tax=Hibiscus sabdariffa TaxID=183260 RepID=A0ABR2PGF7_9ROSI